jgi:exopolysaccharide production protein ExoQ
MWYALRLQRRHLPFASPALWIPTLWMLRCASRSISYWFQPGLESVGAFEGKGERDYYDVFFLSVLIVAGVIALARRRLPWNQIFRDNAWLFLFFAYMALSTLWAPEPLVSAKRFTRSLGDLIMVLITMTEGRPWDALVTLISRTMIFYVPLSLLISKYFPIYGRMQSKYVQTPDSWTGLATHKNSLAAFLMLAAIFLIWRMLRARNGGPPLMKLFGPRWVTMESIYLAMIAYLMLNSHARSTTAIMSLVVGCLLLFFFHRAGRDKSRFVFSIAAFLFCVLVVQLICMVVVGESVTALILELQGKSLTLTDRTQFWPILFDFGMTHPYFGAGYGGFWTPEMLNYFLDISIYGFVPEAHNGYLEVFLNLGFVGVGLLLCIIIKACANAWRANPFDSEYARMRLIIFAMILFHNIAEASFQRDNNLVWLVFLMIALRVPSCSVFEDSSDAEPDEANDQDTQPQSPNAASGPRVLEGAA